MNPTRNCPAQDFPAADSAADTPGLRGALAARARAPASPAVRAFSALSGTLRAKLAHWRLPLSLLACAAVAACGGGGEDPPAEEPTSLASCKPVPHAEDAVQNLNRFWTTNFKLCQVPGTLPTAYADRGLAVVDQDWLDQMAIRYGNNTADGILAHEWGHLAAGVGTPGTARELQADCLAGVYLRWANMSAAGFSSFLGLAGDPTHGTGQQRVNALQRGYSGYQRGQTYDYIKTSLCPNSVAY